MKVPDLLALLRGDGWYQVAQRGSHRQLKHTTKLGASPSQDTTTTTLRPAR